MWKSPPSCGVLTPTCVADVQRIAQAASRAKGAVKLQPLSCGKNWGFGSDLPATDGVYILNLSALRRIRSLSLESHCADIEPGVTQGQLDAALEQEGGVIILMSLAPGLGPALWGMPWNGESATLDSAILICSISRSFFRAGRWRARHDSRS